MIVEVSTAGEARMFLWSFLYFQDFFLVVKSRWQWWLALWPTCDHFLWCIKRYPDWNRVIFHMLPHPDSSQANRMQSRRGRGVRSWLISIEGTGKIWCGALIVTVKQRLRFISKHKVIKKAIDITRGCCNEPITLLGFWYREDNRWTIWWRPHAFKIYIQGSKQTVTNWDSTHIPPPDSPVTLNTNKCWPELNSSL